MRPANIKPISYLKANAAEVLQNLSKNREPFLITQNERIVGQVSILFG